MSNLICGKAAVGGNYNLTHDSIYNDFLSELKGYNVDGLPEEYFLKEEMEANFDAFYSNGADFEGLMQELENLSAECEAIRMQYERLPSLAVEKMTNDYNTVVAAYNDLVGKTSVEFIDGLPLKMGSKVIEQVGEDWKENEVFGKLEVLENDIQLALANYSVVSQITDPSEEWVYNRIKNVASIDRWKAVTKENDPNQLLGKEGGYSTCFYFSVKDIPFDSVRGDDLISKGTDAGGAIEVYPSLESAKNRCSYLSQFDNTLLYSGSYVIAGTMVIRTSYRLSTPEQIALTDEIIQAFTEIN